MPHDPILIGTEFGEQSLEFSEPGLAKLVALPGFNSFLADKFYAHAEEIEEQVHQEQVEEIDEEIDLSWDDNLSTANYLADTDRADELERIAATVYDPVERKALLQEARQIRATGRDQERLLARGSARENARTRALNKLKRKDRLTERAERQKQAHNLRLAADVLLQGIPEQEPVAATSWALDRHACVFGGTGLGKSRLIRQLLTEQLRAGHSSIIIDPKPGAVEDMISCAIEAGLSPEDVILLTPKIGRAPVPGWNPFLGAAAPDIAARTARSLLLILGEGWGPRMTNILTNVLNIMAAHRLSLTECSAFLTSERYRQALLETQPEGDLKSYRQSVRFFREDFNNWPASAKDESVRAVKTRLSDLLEIPFISALLCSRTNTLDLGELWSKQKMIIAHLDLHTLLPEGARIVSTLLAHQTYLTAMKVGDKGVVPVTLVLDELGTQEQFLGKSLSEIITFSRSQGLRLLVATQHFTKISPTLLDALLGNAGLQVYFRLSEKDARTVSGNLAAATITKPKNGEAAVCVELSAGAGTETWNLHICNEMGSSLKLINRDELLAEVRLPDPDYSTLRPRPNLPQLTEPHHPIAQQLRPPTIPGDLLNRINKIKEWEKIVEASNRRNDDFDLDLDSSPMEMYSEARLERSYQGSGDVLYEFEEETRQIFVARPRFNWFGLLPNPELSPIDPMEGNGITRKRMNAFTITREEDELIQELESLPYRQQVEKDRFNRELEKYNTEFEKYTRDKKEQIAIISEWEKERDQITQANLDMRGLILEDAEKRYHHELLNHLKIVFPNEPIIVNSYLGLHKQFSANDFYVQVTSEESVQLSEFLRLIFLCNPAGNWPTWQIKDDLLTVTIPNITVLNVTSREPMGKTEWERAIQILPGQHTIVRTTKSEKDIPKVCQTRVVRVEDPLETTDPRFQEFMRRAYAANGLTYEEVGQTELWRENQIDNLIEKTRINTRFAGRATSAEPQMEEDDSI